MVDRSADVNSLRGVVKPPLIPSAGKPFGVLYSTRTLASFGLLAVAFLGGPRLATMTMSGSVAYGFPLTFERVDRSPSPFNRYEFDPPALLIDILIYYALAVGVSALVNALRRPG